MARFSSLATTALAAALMLAGCTDSAPTAAKVLTVSLACTYNPDTNNLVNGNLGDNLGSADSTPLQFSLTQAPAHGDVTIASATGSFSYRFTGTGQGSRDQFQYAVTDATGQQVNGTVQIINGALRIMPVGDSITYGVTSFNGSTGDVPTADLAVGYRKALHDLLTENGYAVDLVGPNHNGVAAGLSSTGHAGFPGWTSEDMLDGRSGDAAAGRFVNWLNNHTPDAILLHAGSNDHAADASSVTGMLEVADAWRTGNQTLAVLVAQIIKPRADSPYASDPIETFNQAIASYVASDARFNQDRVVNHYAALDRSLDMTAPPTDTTGLHPNTNGYANMAQAWYDALVTSGTVAKCAA